MRESFLVPDKPASQFLDQGASVEFFKSPVVPESPRRVSEERATLRLRAQQNFDRGCRLLEQGESELALLAFQAALQIVLRSEQPEDVSLRRDAAHHLLRLMRNTQ